MPKTIYAHLSICLSMLDRDMLPAKASFFKAIGDPTRLTIMEELRSIGELTVSEIVQILERDQGRVSHHLACLRNCGLVKTRREGKQVYYSLNGEKRISSILSNVDEHVKETFTNILACDVVKDGEKEMNR